MIIIECPDHRYRATISILDEMFVVRVYDRGLGARKGAGREIASMTIDSDEFTLAEVGAAVHNFMLTLRGATYGKPEDQEIAK